MLTIIQIIILAITCSHPILAAETLESSKLQLLGEKADLYLIQGQADKALALLQSAIAQSGARQQPKLFAALQNSLATALIQLGQRESAHNALTISLETARATQDNDLLATILLNRGHLYALEHNSKEALNNFESSAQAAELTNNIGLLVKAKTNAARIAINRHSLEYARSNLAEALKHINKLSDVHQEVYALLAIAQLYQRLDHTEENLKLAEQIIDKAATLAKANQDKRMQSFANGYLGELYERQNRLDEALLVTQRAEFLTQEFVEPQALYRWQWQRGKILAKQGKLDLAISAYQHAVATLRPIQEELITRYRSSEHSFQESFSDLYFELANLLLKRPHQNPQNAEAIQDLLLAQQTVESLKVAELDNYFADDCITSLRSKTTGIEQLAPKTAALYPIMLSDRLELLLSLPQGIQRHTVNLTKPELSKKINTLRKLLEKRTTRQYLPLAQTLYRLLLEPFAVTLSANHIDTLIFIPDASLRTIPLAVLHDGQKFLIEKYTIATTPGLTLTDPRPISRQSISLLVNGISTAHAGFPALPFVDEELDQVAALYSSRVLKNQAFQVKNLQHELTQTPYRIVHIASHGQFSGDTRKSYILAYDQKIDLNALEKVMGLGRYRDEPVELLTLSACETAAGDELAALGMAGIAIKAGARSALASLWLINDRASALLTTEFYQQLNNPTNSKAKALQLAQIKLIRDKRYQHPGYWAPFLLIGNWL